MSALGELVAGADVIVCCGTGGVGKTTTAAAIGLRGAELGRRVVVVTIDPARRLADALGIPGGLSNEPARLPVEASGELWALMLDAATTFDGLVRSNAETPEQAERILANRFYRNVAGRLSGTQEYMAAERLHELHGDPRFDLVVVDTPPTRHALDFLDAPGTLTRFLDHPLFKLLMAPTRRGLQVLNLAAQPVLRTIGKVVGSEVVADAVAFFQAFSGMETGFRDRADGVLRLLHGDGTGFVLVASPRADALEEAQHFADQLEAKSMRVAALVVNRSTPRFGPPEGARPRRADRQALWDNQAQLHQQCVREQEHVAALEVANGLTADWVPLLPGDVHDLDGLAAIQRLLFSGSTGSG